MYKFTNGVVVFTEEDKNNYVKAGYVLVEDDKKDDKDDNTNGIISKEYEPSVKATKRFRR
jgi:hypothetical protein